MKKVLLIIAIIVALAALGFGVYSMLNDSGDGPNINISSGDNSGEDEDDGSIASKVKVESVEVINKTDNIDIETTYPKITSFSDKNFENYINKEISTNIADYRAEIAAIVDDETPDVKLYKYITNYEKYTWGDYLTLIVEQDYQTGGIRSNTWKEIYNINAKTERLIYLDDLFEATVDYEYEIIKEVTKQAKEGNYVLMGGEGLTSLPTKQKFYIKDGKLTIYFDPSEAAAAKYGALEFEMPFTLNEDGHFEIDK